jgi:hypothetical protein
MAWFEPHDPAPFAPGRLPVFILESRYGMHYGFPAYGSPGVKIAKHHHRDETVDPDRVDRAISEADEALIRAAIASHLPAANGPLLAAKTCLYTVTPDRDFIVDRLPGASNIIVASPCSGHGFKFAPAIGEILADLATEGAPITTFNASDSRAFLEACQYHRSGRHRKQSGKHMLRTRSSSSNPKRTLIDGSPNPSSSARVDFRRLYDGDHAQRRVDILDGAVVPKHDAARDGGHAGDLGHRPDVLSGCPSAGVFLQLPADTLGGRSGAGRHSSDDFGVSRFCHTCRAAELAGISRCHASSARPLHADPRRRAAAVRSGRDSTTGAALFFQDQPSIWSRPLLPLCRQ